MAVTGHNQREDELREELQVALAVRRDSDPSLEPAIVENFVEKAESLLLERSADRQRLHKRRSKQARQHAEARMVVTLTSIVFGVPSSALLWHSDGALPAVGTWLGLGMLNAIFAWRRPD